MARASDELREQVQQRYAGSARAVTEGRDRSGCGGGSCCVGPEDDSTSFGSALYDIDQRRELPEAAARASVGCGSPRAVADLREGEAVLGLGWGGGIGVILSARLVGPAGAHYGLDITDE